jgi:hypothetical protein
LQSEARGGFAANLSHGSVIHEKNDARYADRQESHTSLLPTRERFAAGAMESHRDTPIIDRTALGLDARTIRRDSDATGSANESKKTSPG